MTDNRIYLKCRTCGESFLLGSCIGGSYQVPDLEITSQQPTISLTI